MKLYTKSDLERAARLSLLHRVRDPEGDPEWHIREAVGIVAAEGPEYLSRDQAVEVAKLAAHGVAPEQAVRTVLQETP